MSTYFMERSEHKVQCELTPYIAQQCIGVMSTYFMERSEHKVQCELTPYIAQQCIGVMSQEFWKYRRTLRSSFPKLF